jgi:hypothetical protein
MGMSKYVRELRYLRRMGILLTLLTVLPLVRLGLYPDPA